MLVDEITITVKAGNGGDGASTFLRNGLTAKGGPDGGNGGRGGDVYFQGTDDLGALAQFRFKKQIYAHDGLPGKNKKLFGKDGEDLTIKVPVGTRVKDVTYPAEWEITDTKTPILVLHGGRGGRGNAEFKSATIQAPTYAERGRKTIPHEFHLELRFIAHVGLIGLPNAGKSSLLDSLTNATPKIGDYPFTTLEPNLGIMDGLILADIPGLIEGASSGKGLGIKFLKHIEKTHLLVHCIDITSPHPQTDYQTVRYELEQYDKSLLDKEEVILLTKSDLVDEKTIKDRTSQFQNKKVFTVSVIDDRSLGNLRNGLREYFENHQ